MKEEKNDIHYSAEYIRKYLDGQLTGPEMQALEKAALEDPFLADAIDGLEELKNHPVSFESGVSDLQKRLALRLGKKDRKNLTILLISRWQIAASVIFVLGIAIFSMNYLRNKSIRAGLAEKIPKDTNAIRMNPLVSRTPADSAVVAKNNAAENMIMDSTGLAFNENRLREKAKNETRDVRKKQQPTLYKEGDQPPATPPGKRTDTGLEAKEFNAAAKNDDHKGTAPQPSNEPVKARVQAGGNISDSLASVGGTLDEVVVQGYATSKKKDVTGSASLSGDMTTQHAAPVMGWIPFLNYVNTHKRITTGDSLLKGEETITFVVHPNGRLSSFRIEKSISRTHDRELTRLIKTGTGWKTQSGKKQRCRVTVYF